MLQIHLLCYTKIIFLTRHFVISNNLFHIKTMEPYCISCKKILGLMLASTCSICVKKKSSFIKNQVDPNSIK